MNSRQLWKEEMHMTNKCLFDSFGLQGKYLKLLWESISSIHNTYHKEMENKMSTNGGKVTGKEEPMYTIGGNAN